MGDVAAPLMAALTWPLTRPGDLYNPARVRRNLFGRDPRDKTVEMYLEKEMNAAAQINKLRWNFDFENEKPLPPGRYLWERINKTSDTVSKDTSDVSQPDADAEEQSSKTEQKHITDFMRKRKSSSKDFITQPMKTRRRSST